jgi:hypothetical protein
MLMLFATINCIRHFEYFYTGSHPAPIILSLVNVENNKTLALEFSLFR